MTIRIQAEPEKYAAKNKAKFEVKTKKGLSENTVREISD